MLEQEEPSDAQKRRLLEHLRNDALLLAKIIGAPIDLPPTIGDVGRLDGCWLEFNSYPDAYDKEDRHLVALQRRENGQVWCLSEVAPMYARNALQPVFESITHQMAMNQLGNPPVGEAPKERLFAIQEELLSRLDPEWARRCAQRHAAILRGGDGSSELE